MNMVDLKDTLYDLVSEFYRGATAIWTEQTATKPPYPYITLKTNGLEKTSFPVESESGDRAYPCSTILELNLYTKGMPVQTGEMQTNNTINTAVPDLADFVLYLESDEIVDALASKNVSVELQGKIRDLSDLQNDKSYRYRSFAEFTVSFTMSATGAYGISAMKPNINSSGGGDETKADTPVYEIEGVDISEEIKE